MPQRLPQPDDLIVEQAKITQYLLDLRHHDGASKARFFMAMGFDANDWQAMAAALLAHGRMRDVVNERRSEFGVKFVVRCALDTPDKKNPCIDSVWIAEGGAAPRLVTAYPHHER
ncbi:DUF6883 domain-containing protein [Nevskia sp.]|uniref:DUF6883 domain-containing protein n=1 Tax=Nevskia sp. TaxID=1929292 RepID=UPI0034577F90